MDETMQLQLIEQAKRRDQSAIYQLYSDTRDMVYFMVKTCVKDEKAIDAILKDSYISALGNLEDMTPGTSFDHWIHMVAAAKCAAQLRSKKVKFDVKDPYMGLPDNSDLFPPEWAENASKQFEIMQTVGNLPDTHRVAVILHYYSGLTLGEMGRCMGIDDIGANTHLNGAKSALRSGAPGDPVGKAAMTRLLEAVAEPMPAETAKTIFQEIMLFFMSGGKAPKPSFDGKGKGSGGSGGGSKIGAMLPYLVMVVVVILALVFSFVSYNMKQKKIGGELVAQYEASKATVDAAEEAYQREAEEASPPVEGEELDGGQQPEGEPDEPDQQPEPDDAQPEADDPEQDVDGELQDT